MKDKLGNEVHVGDMVSTDVIEGETLYAKITRLPENDDEICEVQFSDIEYDDDDSFETLFTEDIILCTEDKYKLYTVTMAINGEPSSAKIEIQAKSYNEAEAILLDIINYP